MLLMFLACFHKGIPMPGTTRFVGRGEVRQIVIQEVPESEKQTAASSEREQIASIATDLRGSQSLSLDGQPVRFDCSGYVIAVLGESGIDITGNTKSLYHLAVEEQVVFQSALPNIGDIVFFDNSYDRNKNGRLDDTLTHIAIVVDLGDDDTIHMMHLGGSGITDLTMNLSHPNDHRSPAGVLWNSYLRVNRKGEQSPRLTGQLFNSYAAIVEID